MLSVIQVGLGELGRRCVRDLVASGRGRVAAAVDFDEALAGRPLAELVGLEVATPALDPELKVLPRLPPEDELRAFDAAIVTTRSRLPDCAETFESLLDAGLAVVSTCEELVYPRLRHAQLADALDARARETGGRLLGTGVNPGFLMDALPGFLSAACVELRCVRVSRVIDASRRRAAFQRKVGAGKSLEEMRALLARGAAGHVGLLESLHLLAELCGLPLTRHEEETELLAASRRLESAAGAIEKGAAAGLRQVARGFDGDRLVAELRFEAGLDVDEPEDRLIFEGEPAFEVRLPGGLHGDLATSGVVLSALGALVAAPPGLHLMGRLALSRAPLRPIASKGA